MVEKAYRQPEVFIKVFCLSNYAPSQEEEEMTVFPLCNINESIFLVFHREWKFTRRCYGTFMMWSVAFMMICRDVQEKCFLQSILFRISFLVLIFFLLFHSRWV